MLVLLKVNLRGYEFYEVVDKMENGFVTSDSNWFKLWDLIID